MHNVTKQRTIQIGNQSISVVDSPVIKGPTDAVQFSDFVAKVKGTVKFGDLCHCGADRLINVIAEEELDVADRRIVLKCYHCHNTYLSEYPSGKEE